MCLTGEIPDGISAMVNLQQLYLNKNQLEGRIPSCISALTSLTDLHLDDNKLTGEIPSRTLPFPQK